MNTTPAQVGRIILSRNHWKEMLNDVQSKTPEEACGLVAGKRIADTFHSASVIPVTNELHSPFRYRMNPRQQLAAFEQIDQNGWEIAAIYHSHPLGPDQPSPTDIAEAYYPEAITLIWSRPRGDWYCRAFRIIDDRVDEIEIQLIDEA